MMQKGCQKGLSPLGARSPLEGSLLRRETTKQTKQQTIAESWRCFAKVGCIKKGSGARDEGQHASGACGPERTFGGRGPQGAAPSTRTRQKKEGERQKERRTKKERVRKVEKGTRGI